MVIAEDRAGVRYWLDQMCAYCRVKREAAVCGDFSGGAITGFDSHFRRASTIHGNSIVAAKILHRIGGDFDCHSRIGAYHVENKWRNEADHALAIRERRAQIIRAVEPSNRRRPIFLDAKDGQ